MRRKKFRRRNKMIKPRFQLKIAVTAVVFLVFYSLLLGAAVFYPLAADYSSTTNATDKAHLASSALLIHEHLWPAVLCTSVLVFLATILFSHRIAGPMYRFEKTVETLTEGNFSIRIKLRKRDEFHELADGLNGLAQFLENRQVDEQSFRSECKSLLNQLAQTSTAINGDQNGQLQPILDQLMAKFNAPASELTPDPAGKKWETQVRPYGPVEDSIPSN